MSNFLSEARAGEILSYPGDQNYEYKFEDGTWKSRRKPNGRWIAVSAEKYPSTLDRLNTQFPSVLAPAPAVLAPTPDPDPVASDEPVDTEEEEPEGAGFFSRFLKGVAGGATTGPPRDSDTGSDQEDNQEPDLAQDVGLDTSGFGFDRIITRESEGNAFRQWVNLNKSSSEQAELFSDFRDNNLDPTGPHDNKYVRRAYEVWGEEWLRDPEGPALLPPLESDEPINQDTFIVHPEYTRQGYISTREREALERGEEVSHLHICTERYCAQYVSDMLSQPDMVRGNAWHRHKPGALSYSAFANIPDDKVAEIESLFNQMNEVGPSTAFNSKADALVKSFVPDQSQFMGLRIGDIVGLWHKNSKNAAKAFFEGATGNRDFGVGPAAGRGVTMVGWNRDAIGTRGNFTLGPNSRRNGFGMNSHIGFVGAIKSDGEPVIFHNVGLNVKATPLSLMGQNGADAIVWVDPVPQAVAAVSPRAVDVSTMDPADVSASALAEHLRLGILEERLKKKKLVESKSSAIEKALREINPAGPRLMEILGVDREIFEKLLAAAILVADRESDLGTGSRYKYHPTKGNLTQTAVSSINDLIRRTTGYNPGADPSIGPAQIKYGTLLHDLPEEYIDLIDIRDPGDLTNLTKAILAAVGLLSEYYKRAISIGLSARSRGVNRGHDWTSSGSAALDMAIAAYNGGPGRISNYCGTQVLKKKCSAGDPNHIRNYIPASARFGMGYVDEITTRLPDMLSKVRSVLGNPPPGSMPRPNPNLRLPAFKQLN